MADADDGDERGRRRRRAVRSAGALAGVLSALGASGSAGAAAERRGRTRPVCPGDDSSSGPNDWHLDIVAEQLALRESNGPGLDKDGVRTMLSEHDGALILFAASDFGQPRVFLPERVSDQNAALQAILDRVHERRWREENRDLREIRDRAFDESKGSTRGYRRSTTVTARSTTSPLPGRKVPTTSGRLPSSWGSSTGWRTPTTAGSETTASRTERALGLHRCDE